MIGLLASVLIDTAAWRYAERVNITPTAERRYVRVDLPIRVDSGDRDDYGDVRIVDARGAEQPYAIDPDRFRHHERLRALHVRQVRFVPGAYTQVVLDAAGAGTFSTIDIETPQNEYFERVSIESSDDLERWRILRDDAIIYRNPSGDEEARSTVAFAGVRTRFLRVRIAKGDAPFPVAGARVGRDELARDSFAPLAIAPTRVDDGPVQFWIFDTGAEHAHVSAVRFRSSAGAFSRSVTVATSSDGATWDQLGGGTIERFATAASLEVALRADCARYWQVSVDNGNDAPVPGLAPQLIARSHELLFEARPGEQYVLLHGNPDAAAPVYDLAARLDNEPWHADERGTLTPTTRRTRSGPAVNAVAESRTNAPAFVERHAVSLAFVVAAGVLALLALMVVRISERDRPTEG